MNRIPSFFHAGHVGISQPAYIFYMQQFEDVIHSHTGFYIRCFSHNVAGRSVPFRMGKRNKSGLLLLYGLFLSVNVPHKPLTRNVSRHFSFLIGGRRLNSFRSCRIRASERNGRSRNSMLLIRLNDSLCCVIYERLAINRFLKERNGVPLCAGTAVMSIFPMNRTRNVLRAAASVRLKLYSPPSAPLKPTVAEILNIGASNDIGTRRCLVTNVSPGA